MACPPRSHGDTLFILLTAVPFFFCLRVGASMPDFFIADAYFLMIFYFADAAVMSDLLS